MDWRRRVKRLATDRFTLSAALFLLIITIGAFCTLFGVLDGKTACAGYAAPSMVKSDPSAPHAAPAGRALSAAALDSSAPVTPWYRQAAKRTAAAETAVQKALTDQHVLIQLYGGYQAFTDRTVVEDTADPAYSVSRLDNGLLTFTGTGAPDPQAQAASLKRLQHALDDRNIPLLYLQSPVKLADGRVLPYGVEDTSSHDMDALLAALDEVGVDYLDFRQTLRDAGGKWENWFYTTDHHWTQEAAFTAFQALCEKLNSYDQTTTISRGVKRSPIAIDETWTLRENYNISTLPNAFLGSHGKRVGSLYAGMDDFALWTPKLATLMRYEGAKPTAVYGDALDTVLFPERLEVTDPFDANPYTFYAGGDYSAARITNYYNPGGPKILLIRDSYACALTPYLAYASSWLITVDPRYFRGNLLSYIDQQRPDVVLVMYSSGMVRSEQYFRLLAQPAQPSKADALRWRTDALTDDEER